MNEREAREIVEQRLDDLRRWPYESLVELIGSEGPEEIPVEAGTPYQVEVQAYWDDRRQGHLRVVASIDDGGWRAFFPKTIGFIIAPDGTFLGE